MNLFSKIRNDFSNLFSVIVVIGIISNWQKIEYDTIKAVFNSREVGDGPRLPRIRT